MVFLVPQFLQVGQGLGALDAGLVLLLPALVMGLLMPLAGAAYDRIGPRWPATIGLVIAAFAAYLMATITLDTTRGQIMWLLVVLYGGKFIADGAPQQEVLRPPAPGEDDRCPHDQQQDGPPGVVES